MNGIVRSSSTRLKLCGRCRIKSRHSNPDCAVATSNPASVRIRLTSVSAIASSSTRRMDCLVELAAGAFFGLTKPARSGCIAILLSVPPACSTSSAATFSARSMLERSMARYFSEPSLPSQIFSSCELVPEMICNKLFSSLLAFERGSFDGWGDSGSVGTLIFLGSRVDLLLLSRRNASLRQNWKKISAFHAKRGTRGKIDNYSENEAQTVPILTRKSAESAYILGSPFFMNVLSVDNLHVTIADKKIVRGLTLSVPRGEVHAIMGPNGSGKSTLAKVLAGHPDYLVTQGKVTMDGENLLELDPDERARRGLFLAFQYPSEIPGVTIANFLRAAVQARLPEGEELEAIDYYAKLYEKMELLGMDRSFTSRSVNKGFSGGEKKRTEILQLAMLEPKYAVLDETDSGLDIDALKTVAHGVNALRGSKIGILLITHYQRILNYIVPDHVHVMVQGRIVRSGGKDLALELEERGYDWARDGATEPVLTR